MTVADLIEKLRAFPGDARVVVPGYELGMDDIEEPVEVKIQVDTYDQLWNGPHVIARKGKGGVRAVLLADKRNGARARRK
ncbi:MAG: hypothetical protein K2Z80_30385 [Xanthobacteraceae bacterium]|nr:hypothetical protein [Xanthobacteraceae bacterium]